MGMNYGHRMHFARLFSAIIRKPRLTRPRKICYKYQRETVEIGVEKNEKKIWMILVCIISMSFCMAGCTGNTSKKKSNGKIRITTSFYTMYDFAKKIGGDKVEVINLVPAGTEPHDWEPSTKDLIEMEKSDIFIYNGAGMEQWVDDVLESLDTEELTSVEASKGIKLLKDQDAHEHDHEHNSENDPHVWLDPQNAKYEMNKIKKALIKVDAENKDYYEANYKRYAKECDKLDTLYKEETSKLTKKELVVAHEAFGYLCHAYGLEQMGIEGLSADDEPDPKQMSEVIRFGKRTSGKNNLF